MIWARMEIPLLPQRLLRPWRSNRSFAGSLLWRTSELLRTLLLWLLWVGQRLRHAPPTRVVALGGQGGVTPRAKPA